MREFCWKPCVNRAQLTRNNYCYYKNRNLSLRLIKSIRRCVCICNCHFPFYVPVVKLISCIFHIHFSTIGLRRRFSVWRKQNETAKSTVDHYKWIDTLSFVRFVSSHLLSSLLSSRLMAVSTFECNFLRIYATRHLYYAPNETHVACYAITLNHSNEFHPI